MITKERLETLARIGSGNPETETLVGKAWAEVRRCAKLGMRETMVAHLYAARAARLAELIAAGPQGRASFDESAMATRKLHEELSL